MLDFREICALAEANSPYLRGAMARQSSIVSVASTDGHDAALAAAFLPVEGEVRHSLRVRRERVALAVALGDLAGAFPLERVVGALSDFADDALDAAIAAAGSALEPGAGSRGFTALALGKQGGHELNYSSDIDPILLFDPALVPRRARDEPVEAAARMARNVVDLLQTRDADGYVLRVDLRLRPSPEATPLALPVEAAIGHYESSALAWERAAFIKARAAAGDIALGESFLTAIKPFVWRRSLDFGAVAELRALTHRIRSHYASGQEFGPGFDLKRGRGGIREIEFFVQIHQLIHGGRDPALRSRGTLDALAALTKAGIVADSEARTLSQAYRVYRTIEHRLQMVDDRQTHMLPEDSAELDNVAQLHGLTEGRELIALLEPHVAAVASLYDALDGDGEATPVAVNLAAFGEDSDARIEAWRGGKIRALRSPAGLEAFDAVAEPMLAALAAAADPQAALLAFERLIEALPSGVNLFRLLGARPAMIETLAAILTVAPRLSEAVARRPALLDCLIDGGAYDMAAPLDAIRTEMRGKPPLEDQLDRVRQVVGERRFALGVRLIEGDTDPLDAAHGYSRLAEAALTTAAEATIADFAARHGRVPGSEFVVLALGRFGGGALTDASDLDLIYLFTGDFAAESDGEKPLGAVHYYNRLGARLSTALSAATSAGALYEIDTRLRPSGAQGPLAVSLDGFQRYLMADAWAWELMAMTRARPVYGSAQARAAAQAILDAALDRPRDRAALARDVVKMRRDMAAHKPASGPLDVKLGDGGLVDLEFAVHFHQLAEARGFYPDLGEAAAAVAPQLVAANALMTRLLVILRLVAADTGALPEPVRPLVARACRFADWASLESELAAARAGVSAAWQHVVEEAGNG
ncbi:Bifunctional [glutamate--ammonia ligase]-adenylyl-L-tyrosine phosphorylase/[glutamate--ammonia-ligase] adenylyltransferase [Sphingomonas antarctica]|uniref:bifunctional [glutamate--ammonia ligase]-adenylyl-L-tyrosine phosphorylase/[glutamate--ammonia-ligase] adenylyltransferase n=1 Tax=Sphingomonas antarctica TaxID=2040274 RepID=UPI0039E8C33E